jgi:hypothetical protein
MTVPHSGTWSGGRWKLAPCLVAMEAEADRLAPRRRRTSDGSIGDHAHAVRRSDHNPDEEGNPDWVDALDLSHDPANGYDAHAHARQVARNVVNGIEDRVSYIISDWEIFSEKNGVWKWRPYSGANGHTIHAHYSVNDQHRQDTSPWFSSVPPFPAPTPPPYSPPAAPDAPAPAPITPAAPALEEDDMDKIIKVIGREWYWWREGGTGKSAWISKQQSLNIAAAYMKAGASCPLVELPENGAREIGLTLPAT